MLNFAFGQLFKLVNIALYEGFLFGSAPAMQLALSLICFFFRLIFFFIHQLHWQVGLREAASSTLLVLVQSIFKIVRTPYVVLVIRTKENVYGC